VSVIVPVYNDRDALARCLDHLAAQTYPRNLVHLLVVDNGSTEDIAGLVRAHPAGATLLTEPRPGSYAARNRALAVASTPLLAFTDADCLPAADWLEKGVAALEADSRLGLVAGRIELFPADPDRPTGAELYDMAYALHQDRHLEKDHFGATANLFTRKSVVDAVGPFDAAVRSRGDFEWGRRVWKAGYRQAYAPSALVRHPARRRLRDLASKARRLRGGELDLGTLDRSPRATLSRTWWHLRPPVQALPTARRYRAQFGRWPAVRFLAAMYWRQVTVTAEEARIRLGGRTRR
jgi:GT2 family glycosyltransferase